MTRENDLLTDDELIELTGYRFPSKQCSALAKSGISFVKRRTAGLVTWTHVNAALFGDRKIVADEEENQTLMLFKLWEEKEKTRRITNFLPAFIQISTVTIINQPQKNASQLAPYQCPYLSYGQDMRH
jgi:hypothetical protein